MKQSFPPNRQKQNIPCSTKKWGLVPFLLLLVIHFLSSAPPSVQAFEPKFLDISQNRTEPWHITADSIQADGQAKVVTAQGKVKIWQDDNLLQADYTRFYQETNWIFLRGHVVVKWGPDQAQAREAQFDLKNKVGWLKNGELFFAEPHLTFKGQYMERKGPFVYAFKEAQVTACNYPDPDWSLNCTQGAITLDGYARLKDAKFKVKSWPVFYSPLLLLPIKRTRQSGFLLPEYQSSSRTGFGINLPYYQVIDQEQDLTFYFNFMSKKGMMLGTEYRLTPHPDTKGLFHLDWLNDRTRAWQEEDENNGFDSDGLIRPNKKRFWLRGKYNGFLSNPAWKLKLDLDYVSDQNYLREFDAGYTGFEQSKKTFLKEFGRDIEDKDDLTRTSTLSLSRNWSNKWCNLGIEGNVEYTENLEYMNHNLDEKQNPSYHKLPELNFNFYQSPVPHTPLKWEAQNQFINYWAENGTTGVRIDLHPQLSWPLSIPWGTIIPKAGIRETVYYLNRFADIENPKHVKTRTLYDLSLDGYTEFTRIFDLAPFYPSEIRKNNLGEHRWTRIKHTIQPELAYSYIPNVSQADLPEFDSTDRIDPENMLTFYLTNILTRKQETIVKQGLHGSGLSLQPDYLEFLWVQFSQGLDIRELHRDSDLDEYPRRPLTDLKLELTFKPNQHLSLTDKTWFSYYLESITEHEHRLDLNWKHWTTYLGLDFQKKLTDDIHRQDQDDLKTLEMGGTFRVNKGVKVSFDYQKDLKEQDLITQNIGLTVNRQCWDLSLALEKSQDETRIALYISLHQLGQIGQKFNLGQ